MVFLIVFCIIIQTVVAREWFWPPEDTKRNQIPRHLHFIWMQKNLSQRLNLTKKELGHFNNIQKIHALNPHYSTHVYTEETCMLEIRQTNIVGLDVLFNEMRTATSFGPSPYANMANICRLAVLYNHGGIYMDINMHSILPLDDWLDPNADFVAPYSYCELKKDFFNSLIGGTRHHNAFKKSLHYLIRDWDQDHKRFTGLLNHYSEEDTKKYPFCLNKMGTIYTYLGWKDTKQKNSQLLQEVLDTEINNNTTLEKRSGIRHIYPNTSSLTLNMCNMIVVEPKSKKPLFYSHTQNRLNCVLEKDLLKIKGSVHLTSTISYHGYLPPKRWVAGVLSIQKNKDKRDWIRKTLKVPHVFLIAGTPIDDENDHHHDIIYFDIEEDYRSSLTKKVQAFFRIVLDQSAHIKFVIKMDDDVWIDTDVLMNETESLQSPVYHGLTLKHQKVHKDKKSKYYDPIFMQNIYPDYNSGWGYVLDRNSMKKMKDVNMHTLYPMEDVHTGFYLNKLSIFPTKTNATISGNVQKNIQIRSSPATPGIGNQLFFFASANGLAKKNNLVHCKYNAGPYKFLNIFFNVDEIPNCVEQNIKKIVHRNPQTYETYDLNTHKIENMSTELIQLIGYFQSYKYFSEDLRRQMKFRPVILSTVENIYRTQIPKAKIYVGIHVRRNDSLLVPGRNFPPSEYFIQAMARYKEKYGNDITFVVASDDKTWCRNQTFFQDAYILNDNYKYWLDFAVLSFTNHTIMSTGTFGWWTSWLVNGDTIYYQDEFDTDIIPTITKQDYYLPHWTPLRPKFTAPNVTISLCVPVIYRDIENGNLDKLMRTAYMQTRSPDEIILVISDISTSMCNELRDKYNNASIHCTTHRHNAATSRNIALKMATMDFVSFVDADDTMYPNRLMVLLQHLNNSDIALHDFGQNPSDLKAVFRGDAWPHIQSRFGLSRHNYENIAHGHVTVRRDLGVTFREYENEGEDVWFVHDVLRIIDPKRLVYIKQPLTKYVPSIHQQQNYNTTLVTAYFKVESKFDDNVYKTWMRHLCNILDPIVIYTSKDMIKWFETCRRGKATNIISHNLHSMAMARTTWFDNTDKKLMRMIWNEKSEWLRKASDTNVFGTNNFIWIDAGYFRNPTPNRFMFQNYPFDEHRMVVLNISQWFCQGCKGIVAGCFGGSKSVIKKWHKAFYNTLAKAPKPILEDQTWMLKTCETYPDLCDVVTAPRMSNNNPWFYLATYFQHEKKIKKQIEEVHIRHEKVYRVAITQTKEHSPKWAIAHHVYFLYETISQIPGWEPYLIVHNYTKKSLVAFGKTYRTTNINNMSQFTIGISSAYHVTFPSHMTSIAHIQGSEYFNMIDQIRMNRNHTFGVHHKYDAMWLLPHHAWQSSFLSVRNNISVSRTCPYVWDSHILEHRGTYAYTKNSAANIGIYETNVGVYKMSFIPLLVLNKLASQHPNLIKWWEIYGLAPIATQQLTKFMQTLHSAIRRPFNLSKSLISFPSELSRNSIGTIISHQVHVGINNMYLEALYMNLSLVHNSPYFKDCGYYYDDFNVDEGADVLQQAILHHDSTLDTYAKKSQTCLTTYSTSNIENILGFKVLLDEWIPHSTITKTALKMKKETIFVMYAVNMVEILQSWLCNTKNMKGVHERLLLIVDAKSYNMLDTWKDSVAIVVDNTSDVSYMAYDTVGYWRLVQRRLHIFGDILRAKQNIFIIEPDAWWNRNPVYLIDSNKNVDVVGFENSPGIYGFGFLRLHATDAVLKLWSMTEFMVDTKMNTYVDMTQNEILHLTPTAHEQIIFSKGLAAYNVSNGVLNKCLFPSGRWYEENDTKNMKKKQPECNPYVIQNNYIVGYENKMKRAKNAGHWRTCVPRQTLKKKKVGITAHDIHDKTWAVIHHVLFLYEAIAKTKNWEPVLLLSGAKEKKRVQAWTKYYNAEPPLTCTDVYIVGSFAQDKKYSKKCPNTHIIYFNQGPTYFMTHEYIYNNKWVSTLHQTPNTIWTTGQYNWQGDFLRKLMGASQHRPSPYVWEPTIILNRQNHTLKHYKKNYKRVGVYETNRGIYKMSLVPMIIVEKYNEKYVLDYAESYGLSELYTDVFKQKIEPQLKVQWTNNKHMARLPQQWHEHEIGTVVSHTLNNGLNYLWLEAIYKGLALVHNSKHLPKGCGYYYPNENITAGAEALRKAIETHNEIEAERHRQLCLPTFSTSNPDNIAWYEKLLNQTQE